jgi:hypothetical protein
MIFPAINLQLFWGFSMAMLVIARGYIWLSQQTLLVLGSFGMAAETCFHHTIHRIHSHWPTDRGTSYMTGSLCLGVFGISTWFESTELSQTTVLTTIENLGVAENSRGPGLIFIRCINPTKYGSSHRVCILCACFACSLGPFVQSHTPLNDYTTTMANSPPVNRTR